MGKTRNGLLVIALGAIGLVVLSARALIAHGYEAHIGHPQLHVSALIAFCLACLVGGVALILVGAISVAGFVRKKRQEGAEPGVGR